MKNFLFLLALIVGVLLIVAASSLVSAKYPDLFVPEKSEIVLRKVDVQNKEVKRGEDMDLAFSLFNNTNQPQHVIAGFFMLKEGVVYDGVNLDYVSRKQQADLGIKESKDFTWQVPIYIEPGNYKIMIWIHDFKDGAENVVKDYWYPELIQIKEPEQKITSIEGDSINPGTDYYLSGLKISPQTISSNQPLNVEYDIAINSKKDKELVTGIFLIDKNKKYDGENIDYIFKAQKKEISNDNKIHFSYQEKINLPKGEYRVLIWIHKIIDGKEELVEDYFAPGEIEVTDNMPDTINSEINTI